MRFQVALTLIVGQLSFLLLAAPVALPQEAATIKTEVRLVNLTITAAEADSGRLIPGLSREDFEVLEDGIPQNVEYFGKSSEVALSLGIVLDASGSQDKFVKDHRRDIDAFLQQTLKDGDRVMLTGFGSNIRLLQEFTADSKAIVEAAYGYDKKPGRFPMLGPVIPRGFGDGSSVFDAIYNTIRERLAKVEGGRKALLLFSDGEDNSSANHMLDVLEAAQRADVVIYGVHYLKTRQEKSTNIQGRRIMDRLAKDTGGESFDGTGDLRSAFATIAEQLRTSYQAAYRSSNVDKPGSFRNITVRTPRPGVRLRHRSGYFTHD